MDSRATEAFILAESILKSLEGGAEPLQAVGMACARLARLVADGEMQELLRYENSGYPSIAEGLSTQLWDLAIRAGRATTISGRVRTPDGLRPHNKNAIYRNSISDLECTVADAERELGKSTVRAVEAVFDKESDKRYLDLETKMKLARSRLNQRRVLLHSFASEVFYSIKFSSSAHDIFSSTRDRVDGALRKFVPEALSKTESINRNLSSQNAEDWANAAHSCRRLLQEVADAVFPPSAPRHKCDKEIKLGKDNYINRLIAFVEDHQGSRNAANVIGSSLSFLGDRLDAIFDAAQKGSHAELDKRDAERVVVYTYLTLGDVLSLRDAGGCASIGSRPHSTPI